MSERDTMDRLFDNVINAAAKSAAEKLGASLPEPEDVEFSAEHKRKMKRLFQQERNKLRWKKTSKYLQRVAVCIVIATLVFGTAVFSVAAWRVRFLNFIIEMSQTHSKLNFEENSSQSDSYSDDAVNLRYIPEGFKFEASEKTEDMLYLSFSKDEYYLKFYVQKIKYSLSVDTENASVRKTTVNGMEAVYSENNNVSVLVWHNDDFSYQLQGNIGEEELIKIAENVEN